MPRVSIVRKEKADDKGSSSRRGGVEAEWRQCGKAIVGMEIELTRKS